MAWYRCGMNGTYNATTVSRSGAICNYIANVGGVPLSRFIANITPIQEGSGDPSPSNPRAITGWSVVNVNDYQGKNLFNKDGTQTTPFFFGQGNSTFRQSSSVTTVTVYAPCKPDTTYTVSKTAGKRFIVGYGDTIPIKGYPVRNAVSNGTASSITITTDSTAKFLYAYIWNSDYDTISSADMMASTQIEENTEATAYAPFVGQTATINLNGTFYLATLNVLTGLLTVLGLLTTYDKNSSWTRNTSGIFYTNAPSGIEDLYISNMFECYLPKGSSNALADGQCRLNAVSTFINFKVTSCDTVDDFKAFLGDNTIQMVYTLATPQTVQLTPAQLTQLLGENNVWADSGDSEVDFFKIIRT